MAVIVLLGELAGKQWWYVRMSICKNVYHHNFNVIVVDFYIFYNYDYVVLVDNGYYIKDEI